MTKEQMSNLYGKTTASSSNLKKEQDKKEKLIMPAEDKKVDNKNENNSNNNKNDANNNNKNDEENDKDNVEERLEEVRQKFRSIVSTEEGLNRAAEHLFNELIEDAVLGVFLEMHHLAKTGNLAAIEGIPENPEFPPNTDKLYTGPSGSGAAATAAATTASTSSAMTSSSNIISSSSSGAAASSTSGPSTSGLQSNRSMHASGSSESKSGAVKVSSKYALKVDKPNQDIFGVKIAKKAMDCNCPNCDRVVAAARFAPHLEKCMGMGRLSSRIASRRLANNNNNNNTNSATTSNTEQFGSSNNLALSKNYVHSASSSITTDEDEDDVDWSTAAEKRRKKTHGNSRNNGSKRNHSNQKF